jgi:hypothetical protein
MIYCLRFDNQAEWLSFESLFAGQTVDVIGTIYEDGEAITGWHVNAIGTPPAEVTAYLVTPQHRHRVFFGE